MEVWIIKAIYPMLKKSFVVGAVFDKSIAKMISQQSNEEVIYVYHRETICGKLFAFDKDSWMGRQVKKGGI